MSATVMTADGTWSGATGSADGVRDVQVDSQFGIGCITKSVIAAQVMQMVEAGELSLDDPASKYLPRDLDFDTNGATIRLCSTCIPASQIGTGTTLKKSCRRIDSTTGRRPRCWRWSPASCSRR